MNNKIAFAAALFATALSTGAQANIVTNGSFESPALTPTYCYLAPNAISCPQGLDGWSGNAGAVVIQTGNYDWGSQLAQDGSQFIGLQYTGANAVNGQISQVQNLLEGVFQLTWFDGNRNYYNGQATYQVLFDGVVLGTFNTSSTTAWTPRSVTFSLGDGTIGALAFNVVDGTPSSSAVGGIDSTAFIDNIQLNMVPEPGSLALAALALAGALTVRRRQA